MKLPFGKRSAEEDRSFGLWLGGGSVPVGYTRLSEAPEVSACVGFYAELISSMTIRLMENGKDGDYRVRDRLSRFVDVTPSKVMSTRARWMYWIVKTQMLDRNGSAFVLPRTAGGQLFDLLPMPGASAGSAGMYPEWYVNWQGRRYDPRDLLCFIHGADPDYPWRGAGIRTGLQTLAASLANTTASKANLSSPDYKPPMIISVDADSDLASEEKQKKVLAQYIESQQTGKPWILPSNLLRVDTVKPLSISDLAIKDNIELDKKAICSICGVPGYVLGVEKFSNDEYNAFISTRILPRAMELQQELTAKLLTNDKRFFKLAIDSLYQYRLYDVGMLYGGMASQGLVTGNEVRDKLSLEPKAGLNRLFALENYIPVDMAEKQKKLMSEGEIKDIVKGIVEE